MGLIDYGIAVFGRILIMAILLGLGFVLARAGRLGRDTVREMTFVVFRVVTPCVIADAMLRVDFSGGFLRTLAAGVGLAALSHLAGYAAGLVFPRSLPRADRCVYRFGCHISNAGFIALPLAQAVLPPAGVLLVGMYVIVLNVFSWTLGVNMYPGRPRLDLRTILCNPGLLGLALGLGAMLLRLWHLPQAASDCIRMVADVNAPLAMLLTGFYLVGTDVRHAVADRWSWLTIAIRHALLPLALLAVYHYVLVAEGLLLTAAILPACAPCPVLMVMFAASYGGNARRASELAAVSTVLSVLTMPLVLMACRAM